MFYKALGFVVNNVDSTDTTTATTVEYPAGLESQAKAVAAAVHGAKVTETSSVARVTLILGTNGVQANGLAPASSTSSHPAPTGTHAPKAPTTGTLGCIN